MPLLSDRESFDKAMCRRAKFSLAAESYVRSLRSPQNKEYAAAVSTYMEQNWGDLDGFYACEFQGAQTIRLRLLGLWQELARS